MYDAVAGELQRRVWDVAGAQAIGIDPDAATDDELMGAALELERARRALDAVATRVLGELDARGATDAHDGMRTPQWLAHHAGLPAAAASDRVRYARKARSALRLADESLQAGRIGFQHAKVLSDACNPRIADEFAEEAALLAESAEGITFERWRREVLARADLLDADGGHDPSQDIARNRLTKGATIDETYHLSARLIGSDGELVSQSIDRVADELFRRLPHRTAPAVPSDVAGARPRGDLPPRDGDGPDEQPCTADRHHRRHQRCRPRRRAHTRGHATAGRLDPPPAVRPSAPPDRDHPAGCAARHGS